MDLVQVFGKIIWKYRWWIIAGLSTTSFLYGNPRMWALVLVVSIAHFAEFYQKKKKPQRDLKHNGRNVTEPAGQEVSGEEEDDDDDFVDDFFPNICSLLDLFTCPGNYPPDFDYDGVPCVEVKYEDVNLGEVDFEDIDFDDLFVEPYGNYPIRLKDQLVLESLPVEEQRSLHVSQMGDYCSNTLLVGQTPVPKLYEKYWEAIWEEEVGIIVWIGDPDDFSAMWLSVRPYISSTPGTALQFGRYRHECLVATHPGLNPEPGINVSVGTVERTEDDGQKEKREIVLVQLWNWPKDEGKPRDMLEVAKTIDFVAERQKVACSNSVGGVFVHCSDGIMRAPSFIVCYMNWQMYAERQRFNVIGLVNIFHHHYTYAWRTNDTRLAIAHFKVQYILVALCIDILKRKKGNITQPNPLSELVDGCEDLDMPKAAPPKRIASMPDMYGDRIFVTRAPVPNEFIEQLETIWDNQVGVVVWLGGVPNPYMPTTLGQRMRFGEFDQQCLNTSLGNDRSIVRIERTDSRWGRKKIRDIYLVHDIDWPELAALTNLSIVADACNDVYVWHWKTEKNGLPGVLMQCSDGLQRTPTFLACYLGWFSLYKNGKYNVVEIAANVRKYLPGAWTIDPAASNSVSTVFDQQVNLYKIFRFTLDIVKRSTATNRRMSRRVDQRI